MRAILGDERLPSVCNDINGMYSAIAKRLIKMLLGDSRLLFDIMLTWIQYDRVASRLVTIIMFNFSDADHHAKLCMWMRDERVGVAMSLNKPEDNVGTTHVHMSVMLTRPLSLRVLLQSPSIHVDRAARTGDYEYYRNLGIGIWATPLHLAHHTYFHNYDNKEEDLTNFYMMMAETDDEGKTADEYEQECKEYDKKAEEKAVEIVRLLLRRDDVNMHKVDVRRQD